MVSDWTRFLSYTMVPLLEQRDEAVAMVHCDLGKVFNGFLRDEGPY